VRLIVIAVRFVETAEVFTLSPNPRHGGAE
jgi:hypothetical protein